MAKMKMTVTSGTKIAVIENEFGEVAIDDGLGKSYIDASNLIKITCPNISS